MNEIIEKLEHGLMVCDVTGTTLVHIDKDDAEKILGQLEGSVQIEPLCSFLAEYAAPPQSLGMNFTTEECKRAWEAFFRNGFSVN